jgi:hypothetical protein
MCLDRMNNLIFFHSDLSYLHKSKRINYTSYHHPPPVPSGWLRATILRAYDANKSEAARTWVQRASASSSITSVLCPDSSTSRSVFSTRKCDTVAINREQTPSGPR